MITTRRSFVKFLSVALATIPLPGAVKQLVDSVKPDEATLEDAEDILRGLIARCVNGPIDDREASLVGKFIKRMRPSDKEVVEYATRSYPPPTRDPLTLNAEEYFQRTKGDPYAIRFITSFVRGVRPKPWFLNNFKKVNREVMLDVCEVFNRPCAKEAWEKRFGKRVA